MNKLLQFGLTYFLCLGVVFAQDVAPPPKNVKIDSKIESKIVKIAPKIKTEFGKFDGTTKAKPNQTVILDFSGDLGVDPKFDAVPKPEMFRVLKDFSGKPAIIITPGDALAGKTLLIVYADNKNNKTIVATHAIEVTGDQPPTPPKPPTPPVPPKPDDPIKYFDDLKAAYLVSPDATSLDILIDIYKEVGNSQFNKRSDAAVVLRNITAKKLKSNELRKVRDTVQDLLESEVGTSDSNPFDANTFKQFWTNIVAALAKIKANK